MLYRAHDNKQGISEQGLLLSEGMLEKGMPFPSALSKAFFILILLKD